MLDCVLRGRAEDDHMPRKGYWVALADVSDPEGYKLYIAENANAFRKYSGRFLTRGGQSETPEGTTRSRVVVIEFPDYAAALECSRSPEYAKAKALREGNSIMDLAIVEGYDGPQATVLSNHQAVGPAGDRQFDPVVRPRTPDLGGAGQHRVAGSSQRLGPARAP